MSKSRLEREISDRKYTEGTELERTSKVYMRRLVPDDAPLKVLDVGCGTGLNARYLQDMGHHITGIDISPVAIEKFCQVFQEGFVMDVSEGLKFDDGQFDLVFASEVIEHLADTNQFLLEVNRVIRPGGWLVLSTPNSAFWAFRLLHMLGYSATEVQHPGHVRFFSKRGLIKYLENNGFSVNQVSARHMYLVLPRRPFDMLASVLPWIGFQKEPRFATSSHFWQFSRFARKASGLWADTLMIKTQKNSP